MIRLKILICAVVVTALYSNSEAQNEKLAPNVTLQYFQADDELPYVITTVRKRVDRRFYPVRGLPVKLYFNEEESEGAYVGSGITNDKGECQWVLPDKLRAAWESLDEFDFYATVLETDSTEEVRESVHIIRSRIILNTNDETKLITGKIEKKTTDGWLPVEEVEMKFFIKRLFSRLTLGDDTYSTDKEGKAEVEFDYVVPGDNQGLIRLGCMVEDHDEFGNVFAYGNVKWGLPLIDDNTAFEKRSLWATRDRTPWWLLIFPNLIILGVWGLIGYLVVQIIKIKKLAK